MSSCCSVTRDSSSTTRFPDHGQLSPLEASNTRASCCTSTPEDVDTLYQQAVEAGVLVLMPLQDCFWGDRYCHRRRSFRPNTLVDRDAALEDLSLRQIKAVGQRVQCSASQTMA